MVRYKCRYILCKVVYAESTQKHNLSESDINASLRREIATLHGDYAIASLKNIPSLGVRYLDSSSGVVLIRCQRGLLKIVQSSITFVKRIGKQDGFLQTIHVGGTIRSTMKFLIRYHKSQLPKLLMECKTEDEKKQVQAAIVNSCKRSTQVLTTFEKREKRDPPKPDAGSRREKSGLVNT